MHAPDSRAERDVLIIGAGPVGLALAAALAREDLAVTLVDRNALSTHDRNAGDDDWDARVYALSPGSAEFLRGLGAWQRLPGERVAAVETMDVRGDTNGRIEFSAYELGERALAWIVEHREITRALAAAVRTADSIDVLAPCEPSALAWHANAAELSLGDGRVLRVRLVVGADGLRSWARREAGIAQEPRDYRHTAVVANFATERAHRGCAFQWFLAERGVLAWLPLPGRRISIVWSAPEALANDLLVLEGAALAARVADAGGGALGKLAEITAAASFPLSFLRLPSVIGHRFALVGDAAHGVHPLAGQGMNLGLGDAAALASVLARRGPVADPGERILLERYERRRALPVAAMQFVTDGLVRLFDRPALRLVRNGGMRAVASVAPLKRLLAQPALR